MRRRVDAAANCVNPTHRRATASDGLAWRRRPSFHSRRDGCSDLLRRFDKVRIGKVGVARRGAMPVVPEKPTDEGQTFARHNRLTCGGMSEVMQAQAAELRVFADRAPAGREAVRAPAFGVARKQERIGAASTGQRGDVRPRGFAERHRARASLRVFQVQRIGSDVPPAQIEHFAAAASGERQQPDRGDGLGPFRLAGVERASEPGQLVLVEEPRDMVARVLRDAEAWVGAALAQSPLLGPEHHRAQYLEGAVGRAGLVPARGVEPRGHVLGADAVERHPAECGQDVNRRSKLGNYIVDGISGIC